jgi:hypothetical protein
VNEVARLAARIDDAGRREAVIGADDRVRAHRKRRGEHEILQVAFSWEDMHLHRFHTRKLARALDEFATYIDNNAGAIVNYGVRYRCGERISTGFVESAVNQVIARRFLGRVRSSEDAAIA